MFRLNNKIRIAIGIFVLVSSCVHATEKTVFSIQGDFFSYKALNYELEVFELALKKTVTMYGDYQLNVLPRLGVNQRAIVDIKKQRYENYFVMYSASNTLITGMKAVSFPIDLGINSYRVAFVSKETKKQLEDIDDLSQLTNLTVVQKIGWLDTPILKEAGFTIFEASHFLGMFKMVSNNHINLLFRGTGKVIKDLKHNEGIKNLYLDEKFAIYYPLPKFFFTNHDNKLAAKRVYTGLLMAYRDGSLQKIWHKYFSDSLARVRLSSRKIFKLENPFISKLDKSYEQFIYKPLNN